MSELRDRFKKLTGVNCKLTASYDVENCSDLKVKMFNPRYVDWLERRLANVVDTGEKQCNLPVVTAPLIWKDVLDDFYVEHDRQISNGEYKGKMILVFRDWLEKNYQVPERNGR